VLWIAFTVMARIHLLGIKTRAESHRKTEERQAA